jgi:hypothetical protein
MDRGWARIWLLGGLLTLAGCYDPSDFIGSPEQMRYAKVNKMVLLYDQALNGQCETRKVAKTGPMQATREGQPGTETWTVDACGQMVNYRVTYTPDGVGGYNYDIHKAG